MGEFTFWGAKCPCDAGDKTWIAQRPDGGIIPSAYNCVAASCLTSGPEPEACTGTEAPDSNPGLINEGCGQDEHQCNTTGDADGAPTRFSSGRVESNPITMFSVETPDNIFFGYRLSCAPVS
jgi:hypothetical protein